MTRQVTCNYCAATMPAKALQRHWRIFCPSIPVVSSDEHVCSRCQLIKPRDDFNRNITMKGGISHSCKPCSVVVLTHWKRQKRDAGMFTMAHRRKGYHRWKTHPCSRCGVPYTFRGLHAHAPTCAGDPTVPRRPSDPFAPDPEVIEFEKLRDNKPLYQRAMNLWMNYGLTLFDYDRMLTSQNGTCAICNRLPKQNGVIMENQLIVDHCHNSEKVRGLLCNDCNHGLGNFRDSKEALANAIAYLASFESVSPESHTDLA